MIQFLTQIERKIYLWKDSQELKILQRVANPRKKEKTCRQIWSISGLASDESESTTIREGKI